jgi:hypothetical protein
MRDTLFLIFKQMGEYASRQDPRVACIIGTNKDAQEECNKRNKNSIFYYYYMDAEEVKKEGDIP